MLRVLLTIAMLLQVATCSFTCALEPATQVEAPEQVRKCKCCPSPRPTRESVPSEQQDEHDGCICFCNSAANPTIHFDLCLILDSQAVWTFAEPSPPALAVRDFGNPPGTWHSADGSGASLRVAVQSLLL